MSIVNENSLIIILKSSQDTTENVQSSKVKLKHNYYLFISHYW